MSKKFTNLLKVAAGVGIAYLAVGEVLYERLLNKKFTSHNNICRNIEPEAYDMYGKPEDQVDGDAWFVAMHPTDTVVVNTKGKKMHSTIFLQKEPTDKWAIVIHGYTSRPRGMADQAFYFYKQGFNVLMPNLISFGVDENTYCTMGYHDKDYVKEWVDYIVNINSDAKIVILGVSMGSATTMLTTGEKDLAHNVKCAVADCGYTSCWDEYTSQCKAMYNMPSFPFMNAANTVSKLRGNFDFKKCSPISAVARSKTPTLFIHGELDTFVPYYMMNKLFDACTAEKEKLSVPNALHAESCFIEPELYYNTITDFVARYI